MGRSYLIANAEGKQHGTYPKIHFPESGGISAVLLRAKECAQHTKLTPAVTVDAIEGLEQVAVRTCRAGTLLDGVSQVSVTARDASKVAIDQLKERLARTDDTPCALECTMQTLTEDINKVLESASTAASTLDPHLQAHAEDMARQAEITSRLLERAAAVTASRLLEIDARPDGAEG